MEYRRVDNTIILRVQRGEEITEAIKSVALKENVKTASVQGIGACDYVVTGIYEVDNAQYYKTVHDEDLELSSLLGNISVMDGEYYAHFHATFGNREGNAYAGHLYEARVSGTGEIFITVLDTVLERTADTGETGLNLFDFNK